MAAGIDVYMRWAPHKKAIIWVLLAVIVGVAYFFISQRPLSGQIGKLKVQSAKLGEEIREKQAIAANLEDVKQAVKEMDNRLQQALKRLPSKKEIAGLLKTVSDLAADTGLTPVLFQPLKVEPVPPNYFYAEIPLQMEEHGGFYDLARFFEKIARLPRIVTVENITVSTLAYGNTGDPKLKAEFTATTFKYLSAEERPKKVEKKGKKKKRSKKSKKKGKK